jgi:hypothetical protein
MPKRSADLADINNNFGPTKYHTFTGRLVDVTTAIIDYIPRICHFKRGLFF